MVSRGRRRVATVIRRQDEDIAGSQRVEQIREAAIEVLQATVEVDGVVAVPPEHVGLDEVDEDEPFVELAQQPLRLPDAFDIRLRRMRFVDVAAGEDVADLADTVYLHAGVSYEREVVRLLRLQREIVAVGRTLVVARLADERARDHASDGVLARQDLARDPRRLVQLLERNGLLVRSDLKDGVRRRVDDPLAGLLVLFSELLDDLRAGRRLVPEHTASGTEIIQELGEERSEERRV